ncbi:transporter substrate-binding domain-containing protein (plasmid) [Skermanella rosea]|uniref:transporter substrate-binding domain-containing protein n=1 Tax=Skermanella rosea TaxID=1817965 RepID=UPI0019345359|nr:transporter substrate-binding domain-containing protein [Skermanella rosea]UEM07161.1 transporter substrate-binding domain-containing protein [Skermanella rosea]
MIHSIRSFRWLKAMAASAIVLTAALSPVKSAEAANEHFKEVLDRGVLRVGVQGALPPWSYRDPSGKIVGIEPDLAREVADVMGVDLELVVIESANRMQFLQQGQIDLIIGAMSDLPDRRKAVGIVEPNYWTSGANVLFKEGAISAWEDLRGKPVCAKQGLFYNNLVERAYRPRIVSFPGNTETKQALRSGKCVAWLSDDITIQQSLAANEWEGYVMPLETQHQSVWGIAVPLAEKDQVFGKMMSGMIYGWHASGRFLELAKTWNIEPATWLREQHEKFSYDRSHLAE